MRHRESPLLSCHLVPDGRRFCRGAWRRKDVSVLVSGTETPRVLCSRSGTGRRLTWLLETILVTFVCIEENKAIRVTGRGGQWNSETSRLPHICRRSTQRWRWGCHTYAPTALYSSPGTHFSSGRIYPQRHSAAGRVRSFEKSSDLIGNGTTQHVSTLKCLLQGPITTEVASKPPWAVGEASHVLSHKTLQICLTQAVLRNIPNGF
jgi:hypothetical protein